MGRKHIGSVDLHHGRMVMVQVTGLALAGKQATMPQRRQRAFDTSREG